MCGFEHEESRCGHVSMVLLVSNSETTSVEISNNKITIEMGVVSGRDGEKELRSCWNYLKPFRLRSDSENTIEAHLELNKNYISTNIHTYLIVGPLMCEYKFNNGL